MFNCCWIELTIFSTTISMIWCYLNIINLTINSMCCYNILWSAFNSTRVSHNISEQSLWNTITLTSSCVDWSFETCNECGESKCIEQSILGKEPERKYQLWQMQLWWIQIELFRLKGTGAGWEKDHWFVFSCPSFKLWDNDNSKGETEVTIYHSLQHATNQHFCFPCVFLCAWVWEKAIMVRGVGRRRFISIFSNFFFSEAVQAFSNKRKTFVPSQDRFCPNAHKTHETSRWAVDQEFHQQSTGQATTSLCLLDRHCRPTVWQCRPERRPKPRTPRLSRRIRLNISYTAGFTHMKYELVS